MENKITITDEIIVNGIRYVALKEGHLELRLSQNDLEKKYFVQEKYLEPDIYVKYYTPNTSIEDWIPFLLLCMGLILLIFAIGTFYCK